MASYASAANTYDGYDPGPIVGIHIEFPCDYIVRDDVTTPLEWWAPYSLTVDQAMEWCWRLRTMTLVFELDDGSGPFGDTAPVLERYYEGVVIADETILNNPRVTGLDTYASPASSPGRFYGTVSIPEWNGNVGATLNFECEVNIFTKRSVLNAGGSSTDVDHMLWQSNAQAVAPSVYITWRFDYTTPGVAGVYAGSNNPSDEFATDSFTGSFLATSGGGDMEFYYFGTQVPTSIDLDISADSYFSWDGRFNPATGARNW